MGSDAAPAPEVAGAVRALVARADLHITLVGDAARLEALIAADGDASDEVRARMAVVHASEVVTMHDHPGQAFRQKPDSSMRVAVDRVAAGEGDAVVSAERLRKVARGMAHDILRITGA